MIAFIKGIVESIDAGHIVVEQGGIGYLASVPASVLTRCQAGSEIKLLTYLQVKEDSMTLFGFLTQSERSVFMQLLGITGIGPKAALSLLSSLTPEQIMLAVITDDLQALSRAQGIGKKTAGRIALELKDKMRAAGEAEGTGISSQVGFQTVSGPKQDAIDALTSLGYSRGEAVRAVMEVYVPELNAEQAIKLALKKLAQ
ncbi:MAG: Holliday junction branch migration protein RuvA [Defluviitaleaceae bacterium]|nr:Holliday junction branch migration protein RuvA [Defluviitaleaceae bacterium]MCL2837379.1 Holliday junction branch migration protein RuvA [Defluviitaleaceae bacterium]